MRWRREDTRARNRAERLYGRRIERARFRRNQHGSIALVVLGVPPMSNANHYREQARLLLGCAQASPDDAVARQLTRRAHEMLALAERDAVDRPPTLPAEPPSMYLPKKHREARLARILAGR
jgi:hypothetical protein